MRANERTLLLLAFGAVVLWMLSRTPSGKAATAAAVSLVLGLRNNNPGALRANAFLGCLGVDSRGYAYFDTLPNGIRGAARQLKLYSQRGINTIEQIVSTWAPSNENDTEKYILAVVKGVGRARDARLVLDTVTHFALLRAIFRRELGSVPAATISDGQVLAGIDAA